jgi:hypothetical protein
MDWKHGQMEQAATWKDREIVFRFPFENKSAKTIILRDVATSCGCAKVDRSVLRAYRPGEKGVLVAVYEIAHRTGRRLETIYLETDDPKKKITELRLMVVIPELVLFRPGLATWNLGESPAAKSIVARWQGPGRGELRKVWTEDTSWKIVSGPVGNPNEWLITVTPGSTASERIEKLYLEFFQADTGPRTVLGYGVVQKSP